MKDTIFTWKVTYYSTKKTEVGEDEVYEMHDIKEMKDINISIPDMVNEYLERGDADKDFYVFVDKFDIPVANEMDIIWFPTLENLYQVVSVEDAGPDWVIKINRYQVKRFLNWEMN